jgi:hypothetical protein
VSRQFETRVSKTTMNAVIIYDDSAIAAMAGAKLEKSAWRVNAVVRWSIKPWRLDALMLPPIADRASNDAAAAHLIVLAVRSQTESAPLLSSWLETWAARRQVQDAALAVFDGAGGEKLSAPAAPELSRFARRHGLSFITGNPGADDESKPYAHGLNGRRVARTTASAHILVE